MLFIEPLDPAAVVTVRETTPVVSVEVIAAEENPKNEVAHAALCRLIETAGTRSRLAGLIGVSARQVSRWRTGRAQPSRAHLALLMDLDTAVSRAVQLWGDPQVAMDWLEGHNAYLAGRPIDVLRAGRVEAVLGCLDEVDAGGYA